MPTTKSYIDKIFGAGSKSTKASKTLDLQKAQEAKQPHLGKVEPLPVECNWRLANKGICK